MIEKILIVKINVGLQGSMSVSMYFFAIQNLVYLKTTLIYAQKNLYLQLYFEYTKLPKKID